MPSRENPRLGPTAGARTQSMAQPRRSGMPQRLRLETQFPPHASRPSPRGPQQRSPAQSSLRTLRGRMLRVRISIESDQNISPPPIFPLPQTDPLFRVVHFVIEMSLGLLETERSRTALRDIGQAAAIEWDPKQNYYRHDPSDPIAMARAVRSFLDQLGQEFPHIILTNRLNGDAVFRPNEVDTNGRRKSREEWTPSGAGIIKIQKKMMENIVIACKMVNHTPDIYQHEMNASIGLKFIAGITMAHELVHTWVRSFADNQYIWTPLQMTFLRHRSNDNYGKVNECGESGRYWEFYVLGGIVEAYMKKVNFLGARDCGLIYLIDREEQAREVDWRCVQSAVNFKFILPLVAIDEPQDFDELDSSREHMTIVRMKVMPKNIRDEMEAKQRAREILEEQSPPQSQPKPQPQVQAPMQAQPQYRASNAYRTPFVATSRA